jgi:hypothetical protein
MAQSIKKKRQTMLGMVIQSYNPRPLKTGLGGSQIPGQPGLSNSKALSQKKKKKRKRKTNMSLSPYSLLEKKVVNDLV